VSDDDVQSVDQKICERQRLRISGFGVNFHKFHLLFSTSLSQAGLSTSFAQNGFRKCSCVRTKRREWLRLLQAFLERHHKECDEFLNHSVPVTDDDETWVPFVSVETKEQSKQWMHTHSPNKPKKFKRLPEI
jgi:hypothetical protein